MKWCIVIGVRYGRVEWIEMRKWFPATSIWILVVVAPVVIYRFALGHLHLSVTSSLVAASLVPLVTALDQIARRGSLEVVSILTSLVVLVKLTIALFGGSPRLILLSDAFISTSLSLALGLSLALKRPIFALLRKELILRSGSSIEVDSNLAEDKGSIIMSSEEEVAMEAHGSLQSTAPHVEDLENLSKSSKGPDGISNGDWLATVIWTISLALQATLHVSLVYSLTYEQMVSVNGLLHIVFLGSTTFLTVWTYRRSNAKASFA